MRFKEFLQESIKKGAAYGVKNGSFIAYEMLGNDERWPTEMGEGSLLRVLDVTDTDVIFKLAKDDFSEYTYIVKKEKFLQHTAPSHYDKNWLNSLKETTLTEMPARPGEGPRAILATIWKEECRKELDKMPIYKKHTPAGYRRKAKDEMVRMELHQFFKLGDLRDLSGIKDQRDRKHDVKAITISWERPVAWYRGDGGIFKTKADYVKMIPIYREVFQRFIARVKESGLNIVGYATGYSNKKVMASFSAFDIEGDLRGEQGMIELYFEKSEALLRKSEIKDQIYDILHKTQVYRRSLVVDADDLENTDTIYYRMRRRGRSDDELIVMVPKTFVDDLKIFAGDKDGEDHMMSMVDPDSEAGKAMKERIDKVRAARIADLPAKINRGKPDLEKMIAQTNGAIEKVKEYSPYEITVQIKRPSDDSVEWLFDNITKMKMRDYSKPSRHPDALNHKWVKNAEWLFIRIGDRKSVSADGVEQVDQ